MGCLLYLKGVEKSVLSTKKNRRQLLLNSIDLSRPVLKVRDVITFVLDFYAQGDSLFSLELTILLLIY